eukprot:COSAG01_NODE_549_length_15608_cov_206.443355_4_plen_353_part_00
MGPGRCARVLDIDAGGVSPALYDHSPPSRYDSWLTIGSDDSTGTQQLIWQALPPFKESLLAPNGELLHWGSRPCGAARYARASAHTKAVLPLTPPACLPACPPTAAAQASCTRSRRLMCPRAASRTTRTTIGPAGPLRCRWAHTRTAGTLCSSRSCPSRPGRSSWSSSTCALFDNVPSIVWPHQKIVWRSDTGLVAARYLRSILFGQAKGKVNQACEGAFTSSARAQFMHDSPCRVAAFSSQCASARSHPSCVPDMVGYDEWIEEGICATNSPASVEEHCATHSWEFGHPAGLDHVTDIIHPQDPDWANGLEVGATPRTAFCFFFLCLFRWTCVTMVACAGERVQLRVCAGC